MSTRRDAGGDGRGTLYPQVVRAVAEKPWAILPSKFSEILEMVALRAEGGRFTDEEIAARVGAGPARRGGYMAGTVAVLPLYGTIVPKANLFTEMSGGTSVVGFQQMFRDALADQQVTAIVLDIDSPGGMVDLVPELATEIRGSRGKKPIVAVANTLAASAAYWIGAQADEFVVTPSGEVGSIGVFCAHTDISAMEEMLGMKTTLIEAGRFKTELSPTKPLSEEAQAALQARVNDSYGMFVSDVAKGRKVPVADVRSGFGEGRVLVASMALSERMVDRVDTLEATVQRLIREGARAGRGARVGEAFVGGFQEATTTSSTAATFVATAKREREEFEARMDTEHQRLSGPPPGGTAANEGSEAATSGLSFADEASAVRDAAEALVGRLSSLAEVKRGDLTVAKRDALVACPEQLRAAAQHIDDVLAATDPDKPKHAEELLRERARFERAQANIRTKETK